MHAYRVYYKTMETYLADKYVKNQEDRICEDEQYKFEYKAKLDKAIKQ